MLWRENAVVPVLFLAPVCGGAVWLGLLLAGLASPGLLPAAFVPESLDSGAAWF